MAKPSHAPTVGLEPTTLQFSGRDEPLLVSTDSDHAVRQASPALRAAFGVGPDTAAQLLITAGSNPERL
jgi:hypothetical protein